MGCALSIGELAEILAEATKSLRAIEEFPQQVQRKGEMVLVLDALEPLKGSKFL